jgi:hypothetical protein
MEPLNQESGPFTILEPDRSVRILGHVTQK